MKTQKIALAIGALLAGSTAMGATLPGGGSTSNLFLIVYNSSDTNGETYVQALAPTIGGSLPSGTTSYSVDASLSQLETDVGASSASQLTYAVVAGNDVGGQLQFDFTSTTKPTIATGTQVGTGAGTMNSWLGNIGIGTSVNSAVESSGPLTWNGANGPGFAQMGAGGTVEDVVGAATGSPMEFYAATVKTSGRTTVASVADLMGTFSFSLTGDSLTWTPGSTSPVPVPAALWLLISGLAGVGGLSRRIARGSDAAAV